MKTGVEKIIQAMGGDAPANNQTGVQKNIELLGGDPPAKNQTGVDKIVEILESGGGGGNPNRVQTITGTLQNPFLMNYEEYDEFVDALYDNVSAYLDVDASMLGFGIIRFSLSHSNIEPEFVFLNMDNTTGIGGAAKINYTGGMDQGRVYAEGEFYTGGDITPISYEDAAFFHTTLTIIWHPLPDQS